jgi:hypothetical protein
VREFSVIGSQFSVLSFLLPFVNHQPATAAGRGRTDNCSCYFFAGTGVRGTVTGGDTGADRGAEMGADLTGACSSTEPEEDLDA